MKGKGALQAPINLSSALFQYSNDLFDETKKFDLLNEGMCSLFIIQ